MPIRRDSIGRFAGGGGSRKPAARGARTLKEAKSYKSLTAKGAALQMAGKGMSPEAKRTSRAAGNIAVRKNTRRPKPAPGSGPMGRNQPAPHLGAGSAKPATGAKTIKAVSRESKAAPTKYDRAARDKALGTQQARNNAPGIKGAKARAESRLRGPGDRAVSNLTGLKKAARAAKADSVGRGNLEVAGWLRKDKRKTSRKGK